MSSDWDMSDFLKYIGGTAGAVTLGAITASAAAWYMMSRVPPPRLDVPIDDQSQKVLVSSDLFIICTPLMIDDHLLG